MIRVTKRGFGPAIIRQPGEAAAFALAAIVLIGGAVGVLAQGKTSAASAAEKEWRTYGHDAGGMRFSPLTEITPANVGKLDVAWVYHMRPAGAPVPEGRGRGRGGSGFAASEVTPLVVDG